MTTFLASIKWGLQKQAVTCCGTSLSRSQQATSSFLISRSCLCLILVVRLFTALISTFKRSHRQHDKHVHQRTGQRTDTTIGRQFTTQFILSSANSSVTNKPPCLNSTSHTRTLTYWMEFVRSAEWNSTTFPQAHAPCVLHLRTYMQDLRSDTAEKECFLVTGYSQLYQCFNS